MSRAVTATLLTLSSLVLLSLPLWMAGAHIVEKAVRVGEEKGRH